MNTLLPAPGASLSLRDYVVRCVQQRWHLFGVVEVWSDGCLLRGEGPLRDKYEFLPREQWVARAEPRTEALRDRRIAPSTLPSSRPDVAADVLQAVAAEWSTEHLSMRLEGFSMGTMIPEGATLEVVPWTPAQLQTGQVVVWAGWRGNWVAHRIRRVSRGGNGTLQVITRGDALPTDDRPISPARILGCVARVAFCEKEWTPAAWGVRVQHDLLLRGQRWGRRGRRLWQRLTSRTCD